MNKCKDEPKLFYRHIRGKMTNREVIKELAKDRITYKTAQEMSEKMNQSFKTVFCMEKEFTEPRGEVGVSGLKEVQVEKKELRRILEKLDIKKAMRPYGVSNWILKEYREELVEFVCDVIGISLMERTVPKEWKRARTVPIYKGGVKTEPLNYRQVSLTSIVGKICKMVFRERWVQYLEENEVVSNFQYEFRKARLCVTNLLSFYTRVIDAIDERDGWVDTVYLNIKKGF